MLVSWSLTFSDSHKSPLLTDNIFEWEGGTLYYMENSRKEVNYCVTLEIHITSLHWLLILQLPV